MAPLMACACVREDPYMLMVLVLYACLNLETGQLSHYYKADISLNVTFYYNKPNQPENENIQCLTWCIVRSNIFCSHCKTKKGLGLKL